MAFVDDIYAKVARGEFEYSQHGLDQSIIRDTRVEELREAISACELVEDYPDDKYGPSCLLLGFTRAGRPLHVQCSHPSRERIKIITLYEPDPSRWIDFRNSKEQAMSGPLEERLVERLVTYSVEVNGRLVVIENVPARVNDETGERFFSPETVERVQQIVREQRSPSRLIQTPVFDFAA
jgi:hypothetical protein